MEDDDFLDVNDNDESAETESERYHQLKETGDLSSFRIKKKTKKGRPKKQPSQRGYLSSSKLFFHAEERDIYRNYHSLVKDEIVKERGEPTIIDEILLDDLCAVRVRQYRKVRLESMFGRFMDKACPQDPVSQTITILKALGLLRTRNGKMTDNSKEILSKALSKEANSIDGVTEDAEMSYEDWLKTKDNEESIKLVSYTPQNHTSYGDAYDMVEDEDEDDEEDDDDDDDGMTEMSTELA